MNWADGIHISFIVDRMSKVCAKHISNIFFFYFQIDS